MTAEQFWNSEPRVIVNMIDEKREIDKNKYKLQAYYMACMISGIDPDEEESNEIVGIDKPATEDMLKGFNL